MIAVEIILLIIAYTLISIAIFLEIICYKKNIESLETIAFTCSLLLLIISLTFSQILGKADQVESTNIFTLLSMILVGLTTPLNVLSERQHNISPSWKKIIYSISLILFLVTIVGYYIGALNILQYAAILFLGISVISSMIFIKVTKPLKKIKHIDRIEQFFAIAFLIIVPLSLFLNFIYTEGNENLKIGFTLPLVFILLSANKIWDDLHRLSLLNSNKEPKEQHFENYALTKREKEIATILTKGMTYKQISEELHISMPTVKTHASNIYKKCGVKNKSELILLLIS